MIAGHVHISNSISKLGPSIPSVNLPPIITCDQSIGCAKKCYARRGRFAFGSVKNLLQQNYDIWLNDPETYERDIYVAAFTSRFFRFHSSGDIPDASYLEMMTRVAEKCPMTDFLCFTKKFGLVNSYISENGIDSIPSNLTIVFSAWGDFIPDNPNNLPVAYIKFKKQETNIPESARPCMGYCGECVQSGNSCWDLKPGESVVFNEH